MKTCLLAVACAAASIAQNLPPAAPTPLQPDTVVANVAGVDVSVQDFLDMFQNAPEDFRQALGSKPDAFLLEMFRMKYLAAEGDKLKLGEQSPAKERFEAKRSFALAIQRLNFEQDSYQPSEQEIADFYQANQSRWSSAKIKIILLGFKPDTPNATVVNERSPAEAGTLAADLVRQLRNGADFGKLVEQYSDDRESKAAGGDLGMVITATSKLPDEVKKAVFALKPGQIADPVRQPGGIYILRLEEMTTQPLSEVIEPITQEIKGGHRNSWLTELNTRFNPKLVRPEFFTQALNPNAKPGASLSIAGATFKPDTVVATVEDKDITVQQFQELVQKAPPAFVQQLGGKPDSFLEQMYLLNYLAQEADKLNLADKSPLKDQIEWQRKYEVASARVNLEHDSYQPSEQEVGDFYSRNQAAWSAATIKVILIGFKPDPIKGTSEEEVKRAAEQAFNAAYALNDRSQAEATRLAADLVRQLRAGADFAKLAAQYSDDKESKAEGGDFGIPIKTTSSFRDDFKNAIFALKPGEISDPVPQPTGFYIIRLEEKKVQPLREVTDPIKQELKASHLQTWLAELNTRFTPKQLRPDFFAQPLTPGAGAPK